MNMQATTRLAFLAPLDTIPLICFRCFEYPDRAALFREGTQDKQTLRSALTVIDAMKTVSTSF